MDWYLVQSKPRQEDIAAMNIQRLGVESFCPHIKQPRIIRWRKQVVTRTLFPGYLFAQFDMGSQFRTVKFATGVARVVMFGETPARVDETIISSIKARVDNSLVKSEPMPSFKAGQTLQITGGPLCGLEAVFDQEFKGTQRVALLLKVVAYQARVIIDGRYLSAL